MASSAEQTEIELEALSWNLFHGRDFPSEPSLLTTRSRLLGVSEHDSTQIQVNRDLLGEFSRLLASWSWDVALLQECPPHWREPLARACWAEAHRSLTSRNSVPRLRRCLAALNPDLIGSNEGGSNVILVRPRLGAIVERRELIVQRGPRPERRTMAFVRLSSGVCVACLHASAGAVNRREAEREVLAAAEQAQAWANAGPVVFGGDLNLRPHDTHVFDELGERLDLRYPTAPGSLDHLLSSGLERLTSTETLPSQARELADRRSGLTIRLSDHAPVRAGFAAAGLATPDHRG